jgi:hypothetical protein
MANSKNSLTDVGAASGQLKSKFSLLEKTQINALGGSSGSLSSGAGLINGSVSSTLTNASNNARSKLEQGFNIAEQLESSGITLKNTSSFISTTVTKSVIDRTALNRNLPNSPINLANPNNLPISKRNKQTPQQAMKEKLESIVGREDFNYAGIQFPLDLDESASSFIQLEFFKYTRSDPQSEGSLGRVLGIFLPLPENLAQSFGVLYDQRDSGWMGEAIKSAPGQAAVSNIVNRNTQGLMRGLSDITTDQITEGLRSAGVRGVYSAINSTDEIAGGLAGQVMGEIPNPHPTVFFKGLQLRTFPFNWRLIPKSSEEAAKLKQILDIIKKHCLPRKEGNLTLKYPHFVQVTPMGAAADKIGKYKRALVSNITINYTAEGTSAWFHDGYPVAIQLSMEFQEVENFTAEDAE